MAPRALLAAPLVLALLLGPGAAAPASMVEEVRALHAVQLVADPPEGGNGTWLDGLAAGGPLTVTYGQLELRQGGAWVEGKGFLRLAGLGGSRRFLLNSCALLPEGHGTKAKAEFSSHKRIEAGTVRKDFTPPITAVLLLRHLDAEGRILRISVAAMPPLASADTTAEEANRFWHGPDPDHPWQERPGSRVEAGTYAPGRC